MTTTIPEPYLCIKPACGSDCSGCNKAISAQTMRDYAIAHAAALAAPQPEPWMHDCAALCTNDVELWIDACPHCGKPRTAPPAAPAPAVPSDDAAEILAGLFNCMPKEALNNDVPDKLAKRIGAFMFAAGYRMVFDRWYLQEPPAAPAVPLTDRTAQIVRPLPETMSRDEMLQHYSAHANLCAHEALQYQKRIRDLEKALSAAPAVREPLTREQQIAIREAHCNTASDEYFGARPQIEDVPRRRIYEAGFKEGWESGIGGGGNG